MSEELALFGAYLEHLIYRDSYQMRLRCLIIFEKFWKEIMRRVQKNPLAIRAGTTLTW